MPRRSMLIGKGTRFLQNITAHHLTFWNHGLSMSEKIRKQNRSRHSNNMPYYGNALACSNHPGKPASKQCSKCKRGFCKHCPIREDGQRKLCNRCEYL